MPIVTGSTPEVLAERLEAAILAHCQIAFAAGCRLAVSKITIADSAQSLVWDFVVLSPGETPPDFGQWIIYENHSGRAVGRSA